MGGRRQDRRQGSPSLYHGTRAYHITNPQFSEYRDRIARIASEESFSPIDESTPTHNPLGYLRLALEHRPECLISGNALSGASAVLCGRFAMSERKADKKALAHWILTFSHSFQSLLLVVNLLVLGHVGFIGEVIEVTSISFRVQLGNKWRTGLSKDFPFNFGKVLVSIDILDIGESS